MTAFRLLGPLNYVVAILSVLALGFGSSANAQEADEIFAGDSIRVDHDLVGRVLRVEGSVLTVVSRGTPRCRAGLMYGEPAVCDPAPLVQRTVDLTRITIERRETKGNIAVRTVLAAVIGGAAFGAFGYATGPGLGYGKVRGCTTLSASYPCEEYAELGLTPEEVAQAEETRLGDQKSRDQRRGAFFFGVIGGSVTVLIVRRLSVGWVEIHPNVPLDRSEPWGLSLSVPVFGR